MTNGSDWLDGNSRYLAAALAWLRASMEQLAAQHAEPAVAVPMPVYAPKEEPRSVWKSFLGRSADAPVRNQNLLLPGSPLPETDQVAHAAEALEAASHMDPPPALLILAQRLALSQFEQQVLLLCVGMELDTGIAGLCARCQRDPARPYPTFALAFALFGGASWDALSPERPLRFWRSARDHAAGRPAAHDQRAARRRADHQLLQGPELSRRSAAAAAVTPLDVPAAASDLPASHREAVAAIIGRWKLAGSNGSLPIVQLVGADAASKQLVAGEVAASTGLHLYRLPAALLPSQPADIETFARLWQRESLFLPLALYVDALAQGPDLATGPASPVAQLLDRLVGATFLAVRESWSGTAPGGVHDRRRQADAGGAGARPGRQRSVWPVAKAPPGWRGSSISGSTRSSRSQTTRSPSRLAIPRRCRIGCGTRVSRATRPQLDVLARRIPTVAAWDDIVLPEAERRAAAADRRAGGAALEGVRDMGLRAEDEPRPRHQRAVFGRKRHRQDDGGRGARQRAAAEPLPDRSVGGGEQVHRRDREEPAAPVRRGRRRRRDSVLRRGRRAVRQAQRGQGQPRPLRQHRDQLPAAAHGGVSRSGDPRHQHEERARHGLPAPAAVHRALPVPGRRRAEGDLAEGVPGATCRKPRSTTTGWRV